MLQDDEKDGFDEDELFSNPDEQDYQFDQDEAETDTESSAASGEYDLDDDDDDDDDEQPVSFFAQMKQQIGQMVKTLVEDDPRKVLIPVGIAIFSFVIIIYGFVKFIGLFTSSQKPQQTSVVATQTQSPTSGKDASLPITIQPAQPLAAAPEKDDSSAPSVEQSLMDSSQKVDDSPSLTAQPTHSQSTDEQIKNNEPSASHAPSHALVQKTVAMQSALDSRLNTVENNYHDVLHQLDQLAQQTAQNSAQMNNFSHNIQMLEAQVMKLNNVLLDLLSEAKKQKAVEADKSAHFAGAKREDTPELMYYIQAIIPGRAWLKDSNGKIFTVTTGDQIPGYGRVISIEPKKGLIKTDQGKAIEYGIDQF